MLSFFDGVRGMDFLSLVIRLLAATVCGGAMGLERSRRNRPAGLRTHILVCLSGAVAAVTGHFLFLGLHLPTDVTRISSLVISGLGFIGAGTILVTRSVKIKGLTTAAGLWTDGIIGIAFGSGFYEGGILTTALVLLTELVFLPLDKRIRPDPRYALELRIAGKEALRASLALCRKLHMDVRDVCVSAGEEESGFTTALELQGREELSSLMEKLGSIPGVGSVKGEEKHDAV